ncbi:MAG TPA: ATP-binding cassette domain-containing protein [Acidimicrobiia bacterium]|nr:ATP-binding cassette domain-containing protein [Acidimicrobiia bacterium]
MENLTKIYDDGTVALKEVSFEVPDGQFLAVIGLSGSGKSTLLRCINRLVEPTSGKVIWNGEDVTAAPQEDLRLVRRRIGMVFQHFNLVHRSTVLTNVLAGRLGYVNPALSILNGFPKRTCARPWPSSSGWGWPKRPKLEPTNYPVDSNKGSESPEP